MCPPRYRFPFHLILFDKSIFTTQTYFVWVLTYLRVRVRELVVSFLTYIVVGCSFLLCACCFWWQGRTFEEGALITQRKNAGNRIRT